MVEQSVGGVKFSDLPCLDSGLILNLTSTYMDDFQLQGIAVDNDNNPAPKNILDEVPQPVNDWNFKSKGIIFPR